MTDPYAQYPARTDESIHLDHIVATYNADLLTTLLLWEGASQFEMDGYTFEYNIAGGEFHVTRGSEDWVRSASTCELAEACIGLNLV